MKRFVLFLPTFAILLAALTSPPELLKLAGNTTPVHDPAIVKADGVYYVFSTGGEIRSSNDLLHWTLAGQVFEKLPDWVYREIPNVKGGYWAPDISFEDGEYRLYYAVSTFGKNESAIGLAVNKMLDPKNPNYRWIDRGMVLRSHRSDDFNAIDPNLISDGQGDEWLDFGSFWGGIKMRRIDPATGKLALQNTTLYSLASRPHEAYNPSLEGPPTSDAIEAPFIVRKDGWYYLFASFDFCCRGAKSTYYVVVGRSRSVTGPYVDQEGKAMTEGGGGRLTAGTSLWRGPGHEGILLQPNGPDLMVFHAYDAATGKPWLQISTIDWVNGWPQVAALPGDR